MWTSPLSPDMFKFKIPIFKIPIIPLFYLWIIKELFMIKHLLPMEQLIGVLDTEATFVDNLINVNRSHLKSIDCCPAGCPFIITVRPVSIVSVLYITANLI